MDAWDRALADLTGVTPEDETIQDTVEVPDHFGEIIGWRAWFVVQQGQHVRLASLMTLAKGLHTIWTPGRWMEAECKRGGTMHSSLLHARAVDKRVPVEDCTCGFYCARDRDHLADLGYNQPRERDRDKRVTRVIGEQAMVGKVIVADQGWRAEKARPKTLLVPHDHWRLAKALEATYPGTKCNVTNLWSDGAE